MVATYSKLEEYTLLLLPQDRGKVDTWIKETIRIDEKYGNLSGLSGIGYDLPKGQHQSDLSNIKIELKKSELEPHEPKEVITNLRKSLEMLRTDKAECITRALAIFRGALYKTFEIYGSPLDVKVNGRLNSSTFFDRQLDKLLSGQDKGYELGAYMGDTRFRGLFAPTVYVKFSPGDKFVSEEVTLLNKYNLLLAPVGVWFQVANESVKRLTEEVDRDPYIQARRLQPSNFATESYSPPVLREIRFG